MWHHDERRGHHPGAGPSKRSRRCDPLQKKKWVPQRSHRSKKTKAWDDNSAQQWSALLWDAWAAAVVNLTELETRGWSRGGEKKTWKWKSKALTRPNLICRMQHFIFSWFAPWGVFSFCGSPSLSKWCGLWWGLAYSWEPHVLCAHHWGAEQHGHKGWQRFREGPFLTDKVSVQNKVYT